MSRLSFICPTPRQYYGASVGGRIGSLKLSPQFGHASGISEENGVAAVVIEAPKLERHRGHLVVLANTQNKRKAGRKQMTSFPFVMVP
jgi:hypothetical protein